eukprot:246345-Hanusia_phi.AAC.1
MLPAQRVFEVVQGSESGGEAEMHTEGRRAARRKETDTGVRGKRLRGSDCYAADDDEGGELGRMGGGRGRGRKGGK